MKFRSKPLFAATVVMTTAQIYLPLARAGQIHGAETEITDVLITAPAASNLPGSDHLSSEELQMKRSSTSDTSNLLKNLPGISLYSAGGVSSLPAIRGLADDRLRIKVDGMDLISACGNHMNPPLSYTDPAAVASVEIFAGVAPVSLGGDSIGGTIIVDSAEANFAQAGDDWISRATLGAFYRSDGNSQGANLAGDLANDRVSLRYSAAFAKADNYKAGESFKPAGPAAMGRDWISGDEVGSSAYETQNHKLGVATKYGDQIFDLELGYQHIPYQGFPNQRMDMLDNTSHQVVFRHSGEFGWGEMTSRAYHEKTRHKMNFGDDKQFWYRDAPGMPMETRGENSGAALMFTHPLSDGDTLRLGGEIQLYRLDDWWPPSGTGMMMSPNTFWNIRNGERSRYALFGEWQSQWNDNWEIVMGVRHETVRSNSDDVQGYSMMYQPDAIAFNNKSQSRTDENWDFSAQLRFTPDENQTYEWSLARKTRSPNLYERYTWSTVGMAMRMVNFTGDGNGYVGNLELEPEIAHTLNLSADWHDAQQQHWQLVIAPFYTLVDDYIDATECATMMCKTGNAIPGFRYLTFANQDARLLGVDLSGFRHLTSTKQLGNFHARFVISYVDGRNNTTGDNLYNIMPLHGTFTLEQSKDKWSNSLEWELVSAKDRVSGVRNELETSGYGLLSLRSNYTLNKLRLDLGVENLLDKGYDLPLGGAYLGQGMTMSPTGVPWGVSVPGRGRSFYAGVTYKL